MGGLRLLSFFALFLLVLLVAGNVYSLSCVGITQAVDWDDVRMRMGEVGYFTTKVLNSSSGTGYCDPAFYSVELSLESDDYRIGDIFDYNVSPDWVELGDGSSAPVLITLTPKVDGGKYLVLIRAVRSNAAGGTKIISASTAKMTVIVGDLADPKYAAVPFWRIRKDCPGGFVVRQDEECPRVCQDGQRADEKGKCPEDAEQPKVVVVEKEKLVQVGSTAFFVLGGVALSFESFILAAAVIAVCVIVFALFYLRKSRGQFRGGL